MRSASRDEWFAYVLSAVPGALLALAAASGLVTEQVALWLFAPSFVGLNLAHMGATWSHAWLDRETREAAMFERVWVPALIVVACLAFEATGGIVVLLAVQCWASLHHATMQNYGLLRASQRRAGAQFSSARLRLDQAACVLLPLGALTHRFRITAREYDGVSMPVPPLWLSSLLLAGGACALLAFIARELVAWRRGEHFAPLGFALVVGTSLLWSGLLLGLSHPALPLYAIALGHYVQQLYFVWKRPVTHERLTRVSPRVGKSMVTWVLAMSVIAGAVVFGLTLVTVALRGVSSTDALVPPWVAAMVGVNLSHYWLEHRIWRAPSVAASASVLRDA